MTRRFFCVLLCFLFLFAPMAGASSIITKQPKAARATEGETATFTVGVPSPVKYLTTFQWQVRYENQDAFEDIEGATSNSYTTGVLGASDDHSRYRCKVVHYTAKPSGAKASTEYSQSVNLLVKNGISIARQPRATRAKKGDTASFSITAQGIGELTYQWQIKPAGEDAFKNIAGATNAVLTLHSVRNGDKNNRYRCMLRSEYGFIKYSDSANLYVHKP